MLFRSVFAAVRSNPGVTGWGVDLDDKLVREANEAARKNGLANRAQFFQRNVFDADLSKVDVIFMWLFPELQRLLRSKAVLLPGVKVSLTHAKTGDTQSWLYEQGLRGYLSEALSQSGSGHTLIPFFEGEQYASAEADGFAEGEGAAWVVAWTEEGNVVRESYVNLIPTPAGGTHESGLREGLYEIGRAHV